MQTGNGVETDQYVDMDNQPEPESAVRTSDAETEQPAINDLLAAAEQFNAAFNTALYELEASRTLAKEHAARIEELNESILSINTALQEAISEAHSKDEAHARESHALNQAIRELESERGRLRQQITERQQALDAQAGDIAGLTARVEELTATLEQHTADSRRAAEAFARERAESGKAFALLQDNYASGCKQLKVLQAELENRTRELAGFSGQVDTLSAELAALTEAGTRREAAHREEFGRLHAQLQEQNEAIRTKEELLQQSMQELDARNGEIAALNERTGALSDELEAQAGRLREEAETHARECEELNDRITRISGDHDSLRVIHDELATHVENLEQLNRALHHSSNSEQDVHRKIVGEKDAAITELRAKLEAMKQASAVPAIDTDTDGESRASLSDLEARLEASESQARGYAERAERADELEAQVERMSRELQALRESGAATVVPVQDAAQDPDTGPDVAGHTLVTSASIGICTVCGSDSDAEQVISRADLACESGRPPGGNQVVVNSEVSDELSMPDSNARHVEIVDSPIVAHRIKIYYQPISNLTDNTINCYEVFTRIFDEDSNNILPGEIFTMAGNSGMAIEVDRYVIESALRMLAREQDLNMKLFIKLTRQSVCCHDLPQWISGKLDACGINPGQLVFEVAERVMDSELKNLSRLSMALNKIGCKIAIEHYRLETQPRHLHHIHPDYLKIDSELLQNNANNSGCIAKLNEIMDLARLNNIITIAEGVESPTCLAILWELGVNLAQGYFISEPTGNTKFELFEIESEEDKANDGKAVYTIG
jgi:EAL domain-containing protein (putative c-di-GMP-specific phosphodiesterase class I)/predicted  nucleic acid-binding Zn-ribbon protein